jgi:hypothetical protein
MHSPSFRELRSYSSKRRRSPDTSPSPLERHSVCNLQITQDDGPLMSLSSGRNVSHLLWIPSSYHPQLSLSTYYQYQLQRAQADSRQKIGSSRRMVLPLTARYCQACHPRRYMYATPIGRKQWMTLWYAISRLLAVCSGHLCTSRQWTLRS